MPCDTRPLRREETLEERMAKDKARLQTLENALRAKAVSIEIGPTGAVAFRGWKDADRDGISDVCAFRTLRVQNSFELRQAVARAEAMSGRKLNERAVLAGHHAHGGTWHGGH